MLTLFISFLSVSSAVTWGVVGADDLDTYLMDNVSKVPFRVRLLAAVMFPCIFVIAFFSNIFDPQHRQWENFWSGNRMLISAIFKGHTMVEPDDDFS